MEFTLDPITAENLKVRFSEFGDGVIKEAVIDMGGGKLNYRSRVLIHVREASTGEWVAVEFTLDKVTEFRLELREHTNVQVISSTLGIAFIDGLIYLDFADQEPRSIEDFRKSKFYMACKECVVRAEPLQGDKH